MSHIHNRFLKRFPFVKYSNGIITVITPIPYTINVKDRKLSAEDLETLMSQINDCVLFLRDVFRVLDIRLKTAKEKNYTLNIATGEALTKIAAERQVSEYMFKIIRDYNW
jgi:hypothetical protein